MKRVAQPSEDFSIRKLEELPLQLRALETQAVAEGFRFMTRLISEWENRTNRFDQPGECLLGVFAQGRLIGIGGVSHDPYAGPGAGRLRRVYIAPATRGQRIGKALVEQLLKHAAVHFQEARLSTDTPYAAQFYLRCGFQLIDDDHATHAKSLVVRRTRASKAY